jgi:formate dehydrogenase iron-sulfur subunit
MYVLQHADHPEWYSGLPRDPAISPLVEVWKGLAKPLAIGVMAAGVLASLIHYVMKGPNEISKETEQEVENETRSE